MSSHLPPSLPLGISYHQTRPDFAGSPVADAAPCIHHDRFVDTSDPQYTNYAGLYPTSYPLAANLSPGSSDSRVHTPEYVDYTLDAPNGTDADAVTAHQGTYPDQLLAYSQSGYVDAVQDSVSPPHWNINPYHNVTVQDPYALSSTDPSQPEREDPRWLSTQQHMQQGHLMAQGGGKPLTQVSHYYTEQADLEAVPHHTREIYEDIEGISPVSDDSSLGGPPYHFPVNDYERETDSPQHYDPYAYQQHQAEFDQNIRYPIALAGPTASGLERAIIDTDSRSRRGRTTHASVQVEQHACARHRRSRQDAQPMDLCQGETSLTASQAESFDVDYYDDDVQLESQQCPSPDNVQGPIFAQPQPSYNHRPYHSTSQLESLTRPQRVQSPMAHLPYPEDVQRELAEARTNSSSAGDSWSEYHISSSTSSQFHHSEHSYIPSPTSSGNSYHRAYENIPQYPPPPSLALPMPDLPSSSRSQSPPLVPDPPKKPLTLACLFCRKRKIACGSPPPGKKDRTCNQCARRSLKCVYPVASRRGMRPRMPEGLLDGTVFQLEVPSPAVVIPQ